MPTTDPDRTKKRAKRLNRRKLSKILLGVGLALIVLSGAILALTYYQIIGAELGYSLRRPNQNVRVAKSSEISELEREGVEAVDVIQPVNEEFAVVVPKIDANAPVIMDVNPYVVDEYGKALEKGVAHAKGSAYPGNPGNTFLFAHSAVNFYEAGKINVNFYLLDKLEAGDDIYVFFKGERFHYIVKEIKKVNPDEVQYLTDQSQEENTLTLMTCWPAGVNYKRELVISDLVGKD